MPEGSAPQSLILFILLMLSAFFSASETSFLSVNKIKIRGMIDDEVKGAKTVDKITASPDRLLGTVLVVNNLVNISISAITTAFIINLFPNTPEALTISTIIVTVVIIIFGEITPKTIAARNPEKIAFMFAAPISFFVFLFTPVVIILNKITELIILFFGGDKAEKAPIITESDLKTMVDVSHEEGVIEESEREMIKNVFNFGDNTAVDVMTPRTDITAISDDLSYDEIKKVFKEEQFSRIPVYNEDIDHIIGVIHFKDFVFSDMDKDNFDIKLLIRPPFFSYKTKLLSELFAQMRTKSIPMAFIIDEYGGTLGMVSIEDLVEEIVGDISDEYDEDNEEIIKVSENEFIVLANMRIEDFNSEFSLNLVSEEFESIGGFVIELLGAIPTKNQVIEYENIVFVINEIDKNRIESLLIKINRK